MSRSCLGNPSPTNTRSGRAERPAPRPGRTPQDRDRSRAAESRFLRRPVPVPTAAVRDRLYQGRPAPHPESIRRSRSAPQPGSATTGGPHRSPAREPGVHRDAMPTPAEHRRARSGRRHTRAPAARGLACTSAGDRRSAWRSSLLDRRAGRSSPSRPPAAHRVGRTRRHRGAPFPGQLGRTGRASDAQRNHVALTT